MLSVKQGGIKYHFWVFGITRPGIEPRSPGPLENTQTIMLMGWFKPYNCEQIICIRQKYLKSSKHEQKQNS